MLTEQASSAAMREVVLVYFAGERFEMWLAMAAFIVATLAAAGLFFATRTGFALALMITVVVFGSVMGAGLASLMIRDHKSSRVLVQALQSDRYTAAIEEEMSRVGTVISKFRYYRSGAVVLAIIAVAGLALSNRGWVHGIAAGLLLVVVSQIVIDHFSEQRARFYFGQLGAV